ILPSISSYICNTLLTFVTSSPNLVFIATLGGVDRRWTHRSANTNGNGEESEMTTEFSMGGYFGSDRTD
ncbi:hypothetical protein, partial [Rhizobium johnstonii]|uniref:hypothetical protein n=1 Tax=Rhizobium johnstonii TaxID=3019933 RepID=UPI003F9B034D